jgi:glycosyltransferase involved in cell wall biosynthesis
MKIVHTITRFVRGGADENTLLTCNHQAEAGHEVTLIFGHENHHGILGQLHPAVRQVEIRSLTRSINPFKDLAATVEMTRVIRAIAPDIVHTHTSKAGIIGRVAAIIARVPVIVHGVHILPFLNVGAAAGLAYRSIEQVIARKTDYFIDVSEGMRVASIEHGVGTEQNHIVIPSGMQIAKFHDALPFSDEDLCRELGLESPPQFLIVCAAVLEARKRHVEFLDAFAKVVEAVPGAHLAVAGAGPLEDTIMARARGYGIANHVHLLGFRTDVERWMKSATLCTLASEREGLPRTVIQYVLCGRPVVATHLPGIEAMVETGVNGFIVPTPIDMAKPIIDILRDPALRDRLAAASAARDLSPWDTLNMVKEIEKVYVANIERKGLKAA